MRGGRGTIAHPQLLGVLADQHHDEVHGAAEHTDLTRSLFVPFDYASHPTQIRLPLGRFSTYYHPDNLDASVYLSLKIPVDWVAFLDARVVWASHAGAGNLYCQLSANYSENGQVYSVNLDNPALGAIATYGADMWNYRAHPAPLTLPGLAGADYLGIQVYGNRANALDTLGAAVYFLGVHFTYTANQ